MGPQAHIMSCLLSIAALVPFWGPKVACQRLSYAEQIAAAPCMKASALSLFLVYRLLHCCRPWRAGFCITVHAGFCVGAAPDMQKLACGLLSGVHCSRTWQCCSSATSQKAIIVILHVVMMNMQLAARELQDDMEFAMDFLSYFEAGAALMRKDTTLYCVSAWNDHGQDRLVSCWVGA